MAENEPHRKDHSAWDVTRTQAALTRLPRGALSAPALATTSAAAARLSGVASEANLHVQPTRLLGRRFRQRMRLQAMRLQLRLGGEHVGEGLTRAFALLAHEVRCAAVIEQVLIVAEHGALGPRVRRLPLADVTHEVFPAKMAVPLVGIEVASFAKLAQRMAATGRRWRPLAMLHQFAAFVHREFHREMLKGSIGRAEEIKRLVLRIALAYLQIIHT